MHEEATAETRTIDIVVQIRAVRLRWLGHILRIDPTLMVHKAVRHMHSNRRDGDIRMDAPMGTWERLVEKAAKRKWRRQQVQALKTTGKVMQPMVHYYYCY